MNSIIKITIVIITSLLTVGMISCSENEQTHQENSSGEENTDASEDDTTPKYIEAPDTYTEATDHSGTINSISYSTTNESGVSISKTAYVYLPFNYSKQQQYNILFLMHGGGGNASTLMGNTNYNTSMKHIIDLMIQDELIAPLIVVTPTFYSSNSSDLNALTSNFQKELRNDLMPAVESQYATYAESIDSEGFKKSRAHRAFSGFSMGSVTTWYAITENLDYFQYFIPSSADCWAIEQMGGRTSSEETAYYIADAIEEQGYSPLQLFIFAITGTDDMAYENMTLQINAMKELPEHFIYNADSSKGNLYYMEVDGGQHDYPWYYNYLYTTLPYIF